jgi:hypothetical protein
LLVLPFFNTWLPQRVPVSDTNDDGLLSVLEGQRIIFLRSTIPKHVTPTNQVAFYQLGDPLAIRSIYLSYAQWNASQVRRHLIDFMKNNII